MIGETLADRFRVTEKLYGGEYLSTYLAQDMAIGIEVEVDVVTLQMSGCTIPAQRLEEILDASMHVRGRHITTVHSWGEEKEDGFFYVVRERPNGATLAEILSGTGQLPAQQVAEIMRAMVEVLAEAYGRGLFYLGLNPSQILLDGRGGIKLNRVGYAWILEEVEPALAARVSPYRAPETDGGREGSRTSDVYSLAAMVREMMPPAEVSDRLASLLEMAADPLTRHRPSSPRLLLEELEGVQRQEDGGMPRDGDEGTGPKDSAKAKGLSFLQGDPRPSYLSLTQKPRRRILRNLLLVLAGGLVLWLVFAAAAGLLGGKENGEERPPAALEESITLPDLQGLTAEEAEETLDGLGLRCTCREAPSRLWSAGRVAAQEPAEGSSLQPGGTVILVISEGREEAAVGEAASGQDSIAPDNPETTGTEDPATAPAAEPPAASLQGSQAHSCSPPANQPPRAVSVLSPCSGSAPLYVFLDGSGSYDPDGDIVRYVWRCGDGTVLEGATAQHVYDPVVIPARFQVVLEVYDSGGLSHSSALTLEVY
ncbi:MAG: PASTA domain-containing protein [Actinobacteria bacterium]|nr:PASTA domain-containing protein [Actinomycetota bacterium]